HHSVTSCPGLYPVAHDALWRRSRPATGQIPRLPAPEDLLVQLSLHAAFQHGLVLRLVQWLHFPLLLARPLGVGGGLHRAPGCPAESRAELPLAAALAAASRAVGAVVPERLQQALASQLPRPLKRRLLEGSPLALLEPAPAAHAVMRWRLVPGRRLELLRRTL